MIPIVIKSSLETEIVSVEVVLPLEEEKVDVPKEDILEVSLLTEAIEEQLKKEAEEEAERIRQEEEETARIKAEQEAEAAKVKAEEAAKVTQTATTASQTVSKTFTANITAYCPCAYCCGKTNGITASGTKATANRTIAMSSAYAFGTQVKIGNTIYTVEDRGGAIQDNKIDIYFDTHQEALNFGRQYKTVEILN